ncbi:hypothetical protein MA9V1_229 [Chryseobacterium phage MA9V-1]|nr:hypothetical protein MA9V1_229 [Chryseobacterium phage MA9V-1]
MTQETYTVITDEAKLKEFIASLPDSHNRDLVYYVCLFARSKYLSEDNKNSITHIKSDKAQLKRFVATKANLLTKIKQLECPLGSYMQYKTNVPDNTVPQESLALYMTINPRSLKKATKNSAKKFLDMLLDNPGDPFNPSNFAMSEIQRSRGRTDYIVFDLDSKVHAKAWLRGKLKEIVGDAENQFRILETRGGYHILVNPDGLVGNWFNKVQKMLGVDLDQSGDIMIPIPGTHQGGWTPRFV